MKASRNQILAACLVVFVIALLAVPTVGDRVFGRTGGQPTTVAGRVEEPKTGPFAHYSVIATEGHNLLVTDNATNKIYFYTIDKDKPIGSPLKLRASVDLTKVGDEEIKITEHNVEKLGK